MDSTSHQWYFKGTEITKTVGPGPTDNRSGRQNFGPCRPDGPTEIWPNPNFVLRYFVSFRELEFTYRCKDCPATWARHLKASKKDFIYVDILSPQAPSLPHYPLQCPNVNQINKCEQYIFFCYRLSSGPRSVTFIGRVSNVMKLLDRRISNKSGDFVYYYLFLSNPQLLSGKCSLGPMALASSLIQVL